MNYPANLPKPMRVSDVIIDRCRSEIESPVKRLVRAALLPFIKIRYGFIKLGEGFQWGSPCGISRKAISVGRYVYIGAHGSMVGPVVIGDLCMISTHVIFVGNDHRSDIVGSPMRLEFSGERPVTIIEAECWIGQGATIFEGVRIGRGAVVAAGAVVTRSVAPYAVAAGVPARRLRMRFTSAEIKAHDRMIYGKEL
jgi:acetyltransferase-like isoleucine patch superfamily enzyme